MGDVKFMVTLGSAGKVRMSIFDLSGRKVAELTERAYESGTHSITWNGEAADGSRVASGVYFAKASVDGVPGASQRVTLIR
jgi:flagellar hook assembly protein FlgD